MSTSSVMASNHHRGIRLALRGVAGMAVATAIVGVLHLPFAAPLLRKVLPGSVCPLVKGTPEQIDRAHALGAAAIRTAAGTPAPARPALGFRLDTTRKQDVAAWAATHGVSCGKIAGNENLQKCTGVPATALGQPSDVGSLEEVTFEFQANGQLVNVQTLRRHLTPAQAAHTVGELERVAAVSLGQPSSRGGQPTAAHLSHSFLATYVAVHAFTDYRATVSATNLTPTGVMVREEYLSAR